MVNIEPEVCQNLDMKNQQKGQIESKPLLEAKNADDDDYDDDKNDQIEYEKQNGIDLEKRIKSVNEYLKRFEDILKRENDRKKQNDFEKGMHPRHRELSIGFDR